jgi:phosphatidylserine/phosphatidylglycerophosphate/cardiolipin synthase-like enzyme
VAKVASVRKSLWIGTADIKDLHVKTGNSSEPFLAVLARLLKRGVEIRLIHAKEPGPAFREDFDRYPILKTGLERMLCPRVHFKMLIFDFETAYIGSANLTGAGIGMKSNNRRNFEAGILTDEPTMIDAASEQFDSVWRREHCTHCGRRQYCTDPIKLCSITSVAI